ncbi:fasciclin domain-containing protein [Nocardioides panacisoli]|uniref:fasciclin domain-containing protein n=1 Tax=Nocardioides panacisoli TaxID=627624 RepID=UPI001C62B55B|nr:fasciclin domain-containing protein [Nocardioides panacisoli]QYJ03172.1 fasciclin domain-containing protein [Nocardioides panacisoli]
MKLKQLRRTTGILGAGVILSLSLVACGDDAETTDESSADETTSEAAEETEEASAQDQTFGDACSAVPTDGPGSFDGMVQDPVATAASNNPILSTLVTAVTSVEGLPDTLNSAPELTVFAPFNDAFAEIPEEDLNGLVQEAQNKGQDSQLYSILAHHVVGANLETGDVAGEQDTLAGDTLTVEGDESGMTVSDGTVTANVLCGNIPTANATVYVIDKVMTGVQQ